MAAPMEKTRHPGIYKRGSRYVVVYKVDGAQRKESARTLDEARRLKTSRVTDRDRGELQAQSSQSFRVYAEEWIDRYHGNGRRGFTEDTRDDYRRDLERYAYPYFDARLHRNLTAITPRDVNGWIAWLCEQSNGRKPNKGGKMETLSDRSVRRILAPARSCFATAKREGMIRSNPADGAALPHRPRIDEDEDEVRALTREQLDTFLRVVHPRHRLMFRFLVSTGVRWSELVALQWGDLRLNGSEPCVRVRRAMVRGKLKPPKSKYGKRNVPLAADLVRELRVAERDADALLFPSLADTPLDYTSTLKRVLRPAAEEAGAPWAAFHAFRHTCASILFDGGKNAVQVQRWLGHHSPAFTLATYVHLLDGGVGEALDLTAELEGGNQVATRATGIDRTPPESPTPVTAISSEKADATELLAA